MMKKLFLKLLLILSPVIAIVMLYVWKDPFKVLYTYDHYYKERDSTVTISYNSDHVSTRTFLQNYRKYRYDAYIMGGSRSGHYRVGDWLNNIGAASTFHFNANSETLYGVDKKIQLIDRSGADLKHVLLVMDRGLLMGVTNSGTYLAVKATELSGESKLRYQLTFLKAFFDKKFLQAYIDYQVNGKVKPYMVHNGIMRRTYIYYNSRYNETEQKSLDDSLLYAHERFYSKLVHTFYKRPGDEQTGSPVIGDSQLTMLKDIAAIINRHHTDIKIIINPLYNQQKFAPADLVIMQQIFGKENVFDFSGVNSITQDKYNYYENSHYLPKVAKRLMDTVYAKR